MDRPVRILHVIHDLGFGGAQRLLTDLVLNIDPRKYSPSVASLYSPQSTPYEEELRKRNIRVSYLGKHPGLDVGVAFRLGAVLRDVRADIVHTHCYALRYALPYVLARKVRAAVHTVHNLAAKDAERPRWLTALAYRAGVVPVAVCEEVARTVRQLHGLRDVPVILNGVDVQRFRAMAKSRERVRSGLGIGARTVVFLNVARLSQQKNHALLLASYARAVRERPDSRLLIAGTGEMESMIRQTLDALSLHRNVSLLGRRDDVPAILAASDVFVLSSSWEGNPLVVMEAMAAGKPVLCTSVGGVPELIQDGVTGRLVPTDNEEALAAGMVELASDPAKRETLGALAAAEALRKFDVGIMVRSYEELYHRLLGRVEENPSGVNP
jgi:glycosyltransferase involved in cell wall biosynthesis